MGARGVSKRGSGRVSTGTNHTARSSNLYCHMSFIRGTCNYKELNKCISKCDIKLPAYRNGFQLPKLCLKNNCDGKMKSSFSVPLISPVSERGVCDVSNINVLTNTMNTHHRQYTDEPTDSLLAGQKLEDRSK